MDAEPSGIAIRKRYERWIRRGYTDPSAGAAFPSAGFPGRPVSSKKRHHPGAKAQYQVTTKMQKMCRLKRWNDVLALVEEAPTRASHKDNKGSFCLHYAAALGAPSEVVGALFSAFPAAAKQAVKPQKSMPLHLACGASKPNSDTILALIDAYPDAARKSAKIHTIRLLPLHLLALYAFGHARNEVFSRDFASAVLAVLQAFPAGARKICPTTKLLPVEMFSHAISPRKSQKHEPQISESTAFFKTLGGALWKATRCESLILALRSRLWKVASRLVKVDKKLAKEQDRSHRYPLHVAAEQEAPASLVKSIMEAYPRATRRRTKFSKWVVSGRPRKGTLHASTLVTWKDIKLHHGKLAMHLAAMNSAYAVIHILHEGNCEAAAADDSMGCIPLHLALQHGVCLRTVVALLEIYPLGASRKTNDEKAKLPLHIAIETSQSVEIIDALLCAYPDAVNFRDGDGHLPVHLACSNHSSLELVYKLLSRDGNSDRKMTDFAKSFHLGERRHAKEMKRTHDKGQYWNEKLRPENGSLAGRKSVAGGEQMDETVDSMSRESDSSESSPTSSDESDTSSSSDEVSDLSVISEIDSSEENF